MTCSAAEGFHIGSGADRLSHIIVATPPLFATMICDLKTLGPTG